MLEKKREVKDLRLLQISCVTIAQRCTHTSYFKALHACQIEKKAMILNSLQGCEYLYYVCKAFLRRENSGKF